MVTTAVDLFSGIGWGFACADLGIDEHGIDHEPTVAKTRERLGWATTCADVTTLDPADWRGVDGIIASPPCQSWSIAGKRGGLDDPRGQLVFEALRWVEVIRPRWIAMEQVPPAADAFRLISRELERLGYRSDVACLSSETFGVPQSRRRVFLMAHRGRRWSWPEPTHQNYRHGVPRVDPALDMFGRLPWVSMAEALGGDIGTVAVAAHGRGARYSRPTSEPCRTLTNNTHGVTLGDGWPMALTEEQGCTLMGFPPGTADNLEGTKRDRWRIIGNAVCPPVARAVLGALL